MVVGVVVAEVVRELVGVVEAVVVIVVLVVTEVVRLEVMEVVCEDVSVEDRSSSGTISMLENASPSGSDPTITPTAGATA